MSLDAARQRLDEGRLGHTFPTLFVLSQHACAADEFDTARQIVRPRGHVVAPNAWLQEKVGRHQTTITGHVRDLVAAGELVLWEPPSGRNGRAAEYVVTHLATRRGHAAAQRRALFRRNGQDRKPLRRKAQHQAQYQAPTSGAEPLPTAAPNGSNSQTLVAQGSAPSVDACPVVSARQVGPPRDVRSEQPGSRLALLVGLPPSLRSVALKDTVAGTARGLLDADEALNEGGQ